MKINWQVRLRHKQFWISLIALISVFANQIASIFNVDITLFSTQLTDLAETILMLFVLLGILVDPTTEGVFDSDQALTYKQPRKRETSDKLKEETVKNELTVGAKNTDENTK
ncbi:phage holin [Ureibacillus massiliensis]|uniref:phage holin n=1 Tax=Ureibacillus massiliensis TaxID=292806 RepID=UPI000A04F8A9|nr:phage holin [Ureibacillus massiliensis]